MSRFIPCFDVKESTEALTFEADLPGVDQSEISVHVSHERLTITGRRALEPMKEGQTLHARERATGFFVRVFTLPDGLEPENVRGELRNGVLIVEFPKRHLSVENATCTRR